MGLLLAILANAVITMAEAGCLAAHKSVPLADSMWNFLYFLVMAVIFVWILAPLPAPPSSSLNGFSRLPGVARFVIGSSVAALLVTVLLFRMMSSPGFLEFLDSWIAMFASANHSNHVRFAFLGSMTAEDFLNLMKALMLRGGSLISCVFIFLFCRQVSLILANLNVGRRVGGTNPPQANSFIAFKVIPELIWFFSFSLFLIVLTKVFSFEIPEIILWNILLLCAMLYLAQGLGIFQFFLTRPSIPHFVRFFLVILFVVLIFSPVINAILFGGLVLLGIVENWVPMRAKQNGPPSTPEAGDRDV